MTARAAKGGADEPLPAPDRRGAQPFEGLLHSRLSLREFAPDPLTPQELGQLLWATCGATQKTPFTHRTIPSAGALYPLELYLATASGIAHYDPLDHALRWMTTADRRAALAAAAWDQECVRDAPAVVVIAAVRSRTTGKYGERGHRYVDMETGSASQNLLLEAVALGLGGVAVGAFQDQKVGAILELPRGCVARLLVPVGRPR